MRETLAKRNRRAQEKSLTDQNALVIIRLFESEIFTTRGKFKMLLNKYNFELAKLASKDSSRYSLNGIHVTPNETMETDGHQLVRITAVDLAVSQFPAVDGIEAVDTWEPFSLTTQHALEIAKAIPGGRQTNFPVLKNAVIGRTENGTACVGVTDLDSPKVFRPRKLEGQFPKVDQVTPKIGAEKIAISLGLDILVPVLETLRKFAADNEGGSAVILRIKDKDSPIRLECENIETGQKAVAVVMPRRCDTTKSAVRYPGVDAVNHCTQCGMLSMKSLCVTCEVAAELKSPAAESPAAPKRKRGRPRKSAAVESPAAESPAAESPAAEPAAVESAAVESPAVESAAVESAELEPAAVEPAAELEPAAVPHYQFGPGAELEPAAIEPAAAAAAVDSWPFGYIGF